MPDLRDLTGIDYSKNYVVIIMILHSATYIVENYKDRLFDFSSLQITYLDDLHDFVQAASALMRQ